MNMLSSPVGHLSAVVHSTDQQHLPPNCSCNHTWFPNHLPDVALSPSPSPSGLLPMPYDCIDFGDVHSDSGCHSSTSPIAVTGPPLAHSPYGPLPHLSVSAAAPSPAAYSLPPQLYLPQMSLAGGSNASPSPFIMGEIFNNPKSQYSTLSNSRSL